jgi:hypothetical protein
MRRYEYLSLFFFNTAIAFAFHFIDTLIYVLAQKKLKYWTNAKLTCVGKVLCI